MVNMNHYEDPAIYGLTAADGGVFYVGRTSVNTLNRWWQHKSRARSGHTAPVYVRMREVGIECVGWTVLEKFNDLPDGADPRDREAYWIERGLSLGWPLVNRLGTNGVADSWSAEMRSAGIPKRRGRPTWIKGKTGEEAGWTDERRTRHSREMQLRAWRREIDQPEKLYARVAGLEAVEMRQIQRRAAVEHYGMVGLPKSPRNVPSHGTRTMWEKYKCRCQPCRDAGARHNAKKRGNPDWETVTARRGKME